MLRSSDVFGEPRTITNREEAIALLTRVAEKTGQDMSKELRWLRMFPTCHVEVHQDGVRLVAAANADVLQHGLDEAGSFDRNREPFVLQVARLAIRAAADLLAFGELEQMEKVPKSLATLVEYIQKTIDEDQPRFENAMNKLAAYGFKLGELNTLLLDAVHTGLSAALARRLAAELGAFIPALFRVYLDSKAQEHFYRKELAGQLDALRKI